MRNGPNGLYKEITVIHCITHENCVYVYNQKRKKYLDAQRPVIRNRRFHKTPADSPVAETGSWVS